MSNPAVENPENSGPSSSDAPQLADAPEASDLLDPSDTVGSAEPPSPPASAKSPVSSAEADLPVYTRSLLKVAVPVSVQLASKKESVREIVEMAPGSILTFEKGCDQLLQLAVGGRIIAEGEAVKIGDKFGFRVNQVVPPDEQFRAVQLAASEVAAAVEAS